MRSKTQLRGIMLVSVCYIKVVLVVCDVVVVSPNEWSHMFLSTSRSLCTHK